MKFGFTIPEGDARTVADLAVEAEAAGWDALFVWEPVWGIDAWVSLAAAAMRTERIRLGTMLTPISRMRPWKLASETVTLDHLSGGRVQLSVGLGAVNTGFDTFGEVTDRRTRAELMDEGLAILTGLWAGQPFEFDGKHYKIRPTEFNAPPPPLQQPRIPIWMVGAWPSLKSMGRALRYDGLLPQVVHTAADGTRSAAQASLDELAEISAHIRARHPTPDRFDLIVEGETPADDLPAARRQVGEWAAAGATWWNETLWHTPTREKILARIRAGPSA